MVNYYKDRDAAYGNLLARLMAAALERDRLAARLPRVMVMDDLAKPRDTFMLVKGAYDKPAEKVTAGLPASLPPR